MNRHSEECPRRITVLKDSALLGPCFSMGKPQ